MIGSTVRIENLTIKEYKNVKNGAIQFNNKRKNYRASVLGMYGQNGSGKTALIDALELLKIVLCGMPLPEKFVDCINVDAEVARFEYQFNICREDCRYEVWYEFGIRAVADQDVLNMQDESGAVRMRPIIVDEVLSYAIKNGERKVRKSQLIDTRTTSPFVPRSKYMELVGQTDVTEVLVAKRYTQSTSRCFIFSREMTTIFHNNCKNVDYNTILEGLVRYGNRELFVINTENTGLISLDALPIAFKYKSNNRETIGNIMIPLNGSSTIPEETFGVAKMVIDNMNIVLPQIVPDLTLELKDLGTMIFQNGKPGKNIQLMSLKNGKAIPFQYESEGIKKIASILQLLIVAYNNESMTVAIDELDAGIFEYLLGEILNIISERGKGQLIFTSHNLRPLETIDKGFIAFTTTNPENRYIRMTNVKGNNNLRDFYYRDIVLGEQSEQLYAPTNNFEIALAFREAGVEYGA